MYHVNYKNSKKVITCNTLIALKQKIEESFKTSLKDQLLQYFDDKNFQDWVDIDNDSNLPQKAKIRVISIDVDKTSSEVMNQPSTSQEINVTDSNVGNLIVYPTGAEESKREEAFSQRIESLYKKLRLDLKENAKDTSGTKDKLALQGLSNIPITTVPLHIRQDQPKEWLDNLGHYHKRSDIIDFLTEAPRGNQCYTECQELLRDAAKLAEKNSNWYCKDDEGKKKYRLRHGNIVGIVGQAGVGKTTYIKQLVQGLLNPESETSYYDKMYIFYFAFRNVNYGIETTLLNFLTTSCGLSDWNVTPEEDLAITKYLAENENVMILMDGYDEAPEIPQNSTNCPRIKFNQKAKAHVFINNLIGGHILSLSKKIVSSRPRQLYEMKDECIPKFVVKILGLDDKGQQSIILDVCGENKGKVQKMFEKHPDISAFCYAPLNCILTAYCFNQTETDESQIENQHYTITNVLVTMIGCFAKNEPKKFFSRQLRAKEMSDIAWKMFKTKQFYIDAQTLDDAGIKEENVTAFLTISNWKRNVSILSGFQTRKVYFSHLLLEEFFVALKICFFIDAEEFKKISDHFDESQYEVVCKFLFGMFNKVTIECIKEFLPGCYFRELENEKLALLKRLVFSKLNSIQNVNDDRKRFATILQVSSWLYEMKDDEFTKQISLPAPIVISADSILPGDINSFLYFLQSTKGTSVLVFKTLNFEQNIWEFFVDELDQVFPKVKLSLDLSFTNINEEKMKKLSGCFSNVTNLNLNSCKLSIKSVQILSNTINHNKTKLQNLELDYNKIGDEGAGYISTSVQYIENLDLCDCGITAAGAEKLANGLQKSQSKVDGLGIIYNKIGDEGFSAISKVVHKVNGLLIGEKDDENLTMKGISNLCEEIQNLTTPMERLYIRFSDALEKEAKPMLEKLKVSGKLKECKICCK